MSSINFVSQDSLDEARKNRQEEWDKAYKDKENPPPLQEEEPYDPRTLYERLQEQRQKKDDAFAEATKFGNLIHRIDNDEFDFLNTLENDEAKKKKEQADEEAKELENFRKNVQQKAVPPPPPPPAALALAGITQTPSLLGQGPPKKAKSMFSGLVKRKDSATSSSSNTSSSESAKTGEASPKRKLETAVNATDVKKPKVDATVAAAKPRGLVGLVAYDSSSDEEDE